MKVRCLAREPTPEQLKRLGFSLRQRHLRHITPGHLYTVLGLTFMYRSPMVGTGVALQLVDDLERWSLQPLCLFDVEDPRPSRYWHAHKLDDVDLALWPESFFQRHYHDDLAEGVPEVVADFRRVCELLEEEFGGSSESADDTVLNPTLDPANDS